MAKAKITRQVSSHGMTMGGFTIAPGKRISTAPSKLVDALGRAPGQTQLTLKRVRSIIGKKSK